MPEIPAIIYKILAFVLLAYVGYGLFLVLIERSFIYYPQFSTGRDFGDCPALADTQKISYKGARFYYKHVSDGVVVMYHGNAGNACDRAVFSRGFEKTGYSYLLVEYPGYGNDAMGGPSKKRILESVVAVREFLEEKKYSKVVLLGESLGVGVASYHASTAEATKLIFISPYYQLSDMAGWIGMFYPVNLLMRENYTPGIWLKGVEAPMHFIYASDDEIIPKWSMEKLYGSIPGKKTRLEMKGATHNSMYDHPEFFTALEKYLK